MVVSWAKKLEIPRVSGTVLGVTSFNIRSLLLDNGAGQYRYSYSVSNIVFAANQELAIQFDPSIFSGLSNGVAGQGFDLLLLQPNNPPQASGEYSALAMVNQPSLAGPFSVDFTYTGPGTPGSQAFFINQYDSNGAFQRVITSGFTAPLSSSPIPEPATVSLCCAGLLIGGALWAGRQRSLKQKNQDQPTFGGVS